MEASRNKYKKNLGLHKIIKWPLKVLNNRLAFLKKIVYQI
jgi:hypothetical protein